MHGGLGYLQREFLQKADLQYSLTLYLARIPLPLHFPLAEDQTSLPSGQQRLGVPKVRSLESAPGGMIAIYQSGTAYSTRTAVVVVCKSWAKRTKLMMPARGRRGYRRDIVDVNETNDMAFNQY